MSWAWEEQVEPRVIASTEQRSIHWTDTWPNERPEYFPNAANSAPLGFPGERVLLFAKVSSDSAF